MGFQYKILVGEVHRSAGCVCFVPVQFLILNIDTNTSTSDSYLKQNIWRYLTFQQSRAHQVKGLGPEDQIWEPSFNICLPQLVLVPLSPDPSMSLKDARDMVSEL